MRRLVLVAFALVMLAAHQATAGLGWVIGYGVESLPVTGATDWSLTIWDEYGDRYDFAIRSPAVEGAFAHRIEAAYRLVRSQPRGSVRGGDLVLTGAFFWGAPGWRVEGFRVGLWGSSIGEPVALRGGLSYNVVDVLVGQDYVRPAYPGDPGMFLAGPHGESYYIQRGTPVRLEASQRYWSVELQVVYAPGAWEVHVSGGYRFAGSGAVQVLAERVSYPPQDVILPQGSGEVGTPDWKGPYWSVGIGLRI